MEEKIIKDLGANFQEGDKEIINEFIELYSSIASNFSNRKADDKKLYPFIYTAVKQSYIRRGNEGINSSDESGFTVSYVDIEEKLKKDCRSVRVIK